MARTTGFIVAAGGLAAANEIVFMSPPDFNWRIIPATVILALLMGGLESIAPDFAVGLSGLALLAVILTPIGNAGSIIDNLTKYSTGA